MRSNNATVDRRLWFIVDGSRASATGDFTLEWSIASAKASSCAKAVDLTPKTSPLNGTTLGGTFSFSGCGHSTQQMYFITLQPGELIRIGQANNTFDSMHAVFWSETCPPSYQNVSQTAGSSKARRRPQLAANASPVCSHVWTRQGGSTHTF